MLKFNKRKLDSGSFEAASVFDVDGDGIPDIVCGGYWYKGPDFTEKVKICEVMPEGEYFDDFSDYPMDVNGDGLPDIITGGWWGKTLRWRENPGDGGEWRVHDIAETGSIETIRYYDIDGCGTAEIFPNTPGMPMRFFKLVRDGNGLGTGRFESFTIGEEKSGHGMGFGDINGDGKTEILLPRGYLKQEASVYDKWIFVPAYEMPFWGVSVPILAYDVNQDGRMDMIYGNGHGYGLNWAEQLDNGSFLHHTIDSAAAQYHDLWLVDIDGDGQPELVTGKRYRAHCGNDPGDNDPCGLYYYKINKGQFVRYVIDFGEAGEGSGAGIYMWIEDITGNGYPDIVAPGKDGLYLFENQGLKQAGEEIR